MQLEGKKVIVLGERDGVAGPGDRRLRAASAGAEVVYVQTECFV